MSSRDESLYSGITVPDKPEHVFLRSDWFRPKPPEGYPNLVVMKVPVNAGTSTAWVLDFLNTETGEFASEKNDLDIEWPWIEHFHPSVDDWEVIGIPALT